ncbi:MAG TPA: hypothetical protein VD967_00180 [Candidatus Paceibacterota bacterium]|nr:hypothetical protein [Candidatus Paceibacterota bacterium]
MSAKIFSQGLPSPALLEKYREVFALREAGVGDEDDLPDLKELSRYGMVPIEPRQDAAWDQVLPFSTGETQGDNLATPPKEVIEEILRLKRTGFFDSFEFRNDPIGGWNLQAVFAVYEDSRWLVALWRPGEAEVPSLAEIEEEAKGRAQAFVEFYKRRHPPWRRYASLVVFWFGVLTGLIGLQAILAKAVGGGEPLALLGFAPLDMAALPVFFVGAILVALIAPMLSVRKDFWIEREFREAKMILGESQTAAP